MTPKSSDVPQNGIPALPPRRLLIVRELEQFASDGVVQWTPELVEAIIGWSDLGTDAPGVYRLALVSRTLTTEQAEGQEATFSKLLFAWNDSLSEERRLQLSIVYGNTASSHSGPQYRCDGSDRLGRVEFFTQEYFDRMPDRGYHDRTLGGWHGILDRSLQSHYLTVLNWQPEGGYPDGWLEDGFVHQGQPYRHVVMLDRTPEGGLTHKLLAV